MKIKLVIMALAMCATCVAKDIKRVVLNTNPEMHCSNCENRIKEGLRFEKGVSDIKTDLTTKTVTVTYDADKTSQQNIIAALAKINYAATPASAAKASNAGGEKKDGDKKGGMRSKKAQFKAEQMRCGGCANKVKKLMMGIDGVDSVSVDMSTKVVSVYYQSAKTNTDAMKEAFKTINYNVEQIMPAAKAPLPEKPRYESDATVKFKAEQMRCGGCANKVKRLMYTIDGVAWVEVDMQTKTVTVNYQSAKTNPAAMNDAFKTINYNVEKL